MINKVSCMSGQEYKKQNKLKLKSQDKHTTDKIFFSLHFFYVHTVNSRYNEPRVEIEKSLLYREFVILKTFKILVSNIQFLSKLSSSTIM